MSEVWIWSVLLCFINTKQLPAHCLRCKYPFSLLCMCVSTYVFCIGMGAQTWQPQPRQGHHLSFLHTLRDTLLEKLRRSRSFGDLAALRPRPRSSLEVYVSQVIVCAQLLSKHVCACVVILLNLLYPVPVSHCLVIFFLDLLHHLHDQNFCD